MYRIASLLLGLGFSIYSLTAASAQDRVPPPQEKQPPAKAPGLEEIKKAIADLGSRRFAVREKAKKLLQEAGAAAEPLLADAAKSTDEETANSAQAILDKFQWGLYPDTPKSVRDLIEQFRIGTPEQRQNAIVALMKEKPLPFATIRKLLAKEEDAEARKQMFQNLYAQVREAIPQLLMKGDYDSAEILFELALSGSPSFSAADYAVFMYLRGKIDESIKRFEKARAAPGEKGEQAAEVLVYLYRIKGDWPSARRAAESAKKDELVERVLWQSGDWKALAGFSQKPQFGNIPGIIAAYDRLAGDTKAFGEKIDEIIKSAETEQEDRSSFRQDAHALLLNGKAADAMRIMVDRKKEMAFTFDLLCAQMKHKEAFALVDEARRRDTDPQERNEIEIRRARMLYLLGEKDAATQLFEKLAGEIKGEDIGGFAPSLVKAEARVGLRDKAADHAAKAIDLFQKNGRQGSAGSLLEPIFGADNKDVALAWWNLFRRENPNEEPAVAMKRVRDALTGKLDKKSLDDWVAKMQKSPPPDADQPVPRGRAVARTNFHGYDAIAAAFRAAGDEAKTEEFLKKAAEKGPTPERWVAHGDFLMAKKKYKLAAESYAKAARVTTRLNAADLEIGDDDDVLQLLEEQGSALPAYLQGRALVMAGDEREGKRLIALAHWLPLGNEQMRAKLVDELNKRDWPEMARKEADMLLKTGWYHHFSYGNVLSYLARQSAKERDFAKAADYYEKCIVGCLRTGANFVEPTAYLIVPESVRAYRARSLIAQGKTEQGLKEAAANLEVMPGNIELAIKVVPELEKLGKKKEADAIYEKVRDVYEKLSKDYPSSAFARNSAAWIMANCRRDLDAALKYAGKAVELEPNNAGYKDTLAEVNFRKGNREKALALMNQCVELDPKNPYFKKQLLRFKDQPFDSPLPDDGEDED